MMPSMLIPLEALPLTPNGKIDRRSLPVPSSDRPQLSVDYESPKTSTEQIIAEVWRQLLQLDEIGIHDNFFDLGGHSLLLVQVHSQLRQHFQADLSMLDLFRYPTIHTLADYLSKGDPGMSSDRDNRRENQLKTGKTRLAQRRQRRPISSKNAL